MNVHEISIDISNYGAGLMQSGAGRQIECPSLFDDCLMNDTTDIPISLFFAHAPHGVHGGVSDAFTNAFQHSNRHHETQGLPGCKGCDRCEDRSRQHAQAEHPLIMQ